MKNCVSHKVIALKKKNITSPIKAKTKQLAYEAVSEWVSERVLHEDKSHSTGLTMSDP